MVLYMCNFKDNTYLLYARCLDQDCSFLWQTEVEGNETRFERISAIYSDWNCVAPTKPGGNGVYMFQENISGRKQWEEVLELSFLCRLYSKGGFEGKQYSPYVVNFTFKRIILFFILWARTIACWNGHYSMHRNTHCSMVRWAWSDVSIRIIICKLAIANTFHLCKHSFLMEEHFWKIRHLLQAHHAKLIFFKRAKMPVACSIMSYLTQSTTLYIADRGQECCTKTAPAHRFFARCILMKVE